MVSFKVVCRMLFAAAAFLVCTPAHALTLECEIGVAYGTKFGPTRTYTLSIDGQQDFVMGASGSKSNRLAILRRINNESVRALELDNGEPGVQATLILWPNPRLELVLKGGFTQTDICIER